jgi:hypothetical protein
LALVYHEARNVRHLIQAGHASAADWQTLVSSLPKDRVEAWKQIQSSRDIARTKTSAHAPRLVFSKRFGKGLAELEALFQDANWKHASAWGGLAWREVVTIVSDLGRAIDQSDAALVVDICARLRAARHNNGCLRDKIEQLDSVVGVTTDASWFNPTIGATPMTAEAPELECPKCKDGVMLKRLETGRVAVGQQATEPVVSWYECPDCDRRWTYVHEYKRLAEGSDYPQ